MIETENLEWKVKHDPSHAVLKKCIDDLINSIIRVTSVVPRIDTVFRDDRQKILGSIRSQIEEIANGSQQSTPEIQGMIQKVFGSSF